MLTHGGYVQHVLSFQKKHLRSILVGGDEGTLTLGLGNMMGMARHLLAPSWDCGGVVNVALGEENKHEIWPLGNSVGVTRRELPK